jgi:hypothetical protein
VFLIGHWKSFRELEDNLSMPELVAVLDAHRKKSERQMRWDAALQGVEIGESESEAAKADFEETWRRGMGLDDPEKAEEDILSTLGIGYELDG